MGWEIIIGGACLGAFASLLSSIGYFVNRRLHNDIERQLIHRGFVPGPELDSHRDGSEWLTQEFWLATLLLVLGAVSTTANLGLLGQMAIAPFAAFTLVYNALLGRCLDPPEAYTWIHFLSSLTIVAGIAVTVAQIPSEVRNFPPEEIADLHMRTEIIVLTGSLVAFLFISALAVQANSAEGLCYRSPNGSHDGKHRDEEKLLVQEESGGGAGELSTFDFSRSNWGLGYYCLCCGLCAMLNGVLLKTLVEYLKAGASNGTGPFNLGRWEFWFCFCWLIPMVFTQLWFLNQGLRRHQSVVMIPPMIALLMVCNSTGGLIYFKEAQNFETRNLATFYGGIAICIIGALVIMFADTTSTVEGTRAPLLQEDIINENFRAKCA